MENSILIKKSQAWGIDLFIAVTIFALGALIFFLYTLNTSNPESKLDSLSYDGNIIANILLSEGSPSDWNESNLTSPGLLSNNKINQTKLERFYNLSSDYENTKKILNTKFDFYFYLSEPIEIQGSFIEGMGKPGVNSSNIIDIENPENIFKITRFTIYKNKPIQFNLYTWV
jgi:hypothetical protein